jgi:hypothetical protein
MYSHSFIPQILLKCCCQAMFLTTVIKAVMKINEKPCPGRGTQEVGEKW